MADFIDLDELIESGGQRVGTPSPGFTDLDALAGAPAPRTPAPSQGYTDLDSLTEAEESVGGSQVRQDAEARRRAEIDAYVQRQRGAAPEGLARVVPALAQFMEPTIRTGRRVGERLRESGEAVLSLPGLIKKWATGEAQGGLSGLVTGETRPVTLKDVGWTALRAAGAPFEPIFAPIGESIRTAAEGFVSPETAQTIGAAGEMGAGVALPFVRVPATPVTRGLTKVGIGRLPEEAAQAERAIEMAKAIPPGARPLIDPEDVAGSLARLGLEAPRSPLTVEPPTPRAPREAVSEPPGVVELGVSEAPTEGRWTELRRFLFGTDKSPEYTIWQRSRRGELASRAEDVGELGKEMREATRAEAARLGVSTQEAGGRMGLALKGATQDLGPEAQAIVPKVRAQIDANSRALAERGIIGEAAEEAGRGTYARRVYARDILGGEEWAGMVPDDVRADAVQYILAHNKIKIGKGQYRPPTQEEAIAIADGIERGRITQANFGGRAVSMPIGQTMRRKDIPEPIRKLMGEVEEGTYLAARTLADQNRLIVNHDFLDAFSTMGEVINGQHVPWVSRTPAPGYRAVPVNRLVKQAMGAGAKDEVYVLARYANDFARQFGPQSVDLFDKLYNPIYSAFKMSKTVLNPATHLRNITGNVMFSDLADTFALDPRNWRYYRDAARAILKKDSLWKEGLQYGVIGTEYGTAELGLVAREFALAQSPVQAATRLALSPVKKVSTLYNAEDQVFKLAAYIKQVAQGKLPWEASAWTNKWYPNYADVPEAVQLLRQGKGSLIGSPFVSFASEAARIGATAAKEQPLTLAKWLLGVPAATVASAAYVGADLDELRSAYRKLPAHMRSPFTMLLPWRDAKGHLQVTDQRYSHPLGQILGGLVGGQDDRGRLFNLPFVSEFLAGNPIVNLAWELGTNTNLSPFASGEPLVRPSDRPIGRRVEHSLRALGPSLLPNIPGVTERGGPAFEQIKKSVEGKPGRFGQRQTPFGALVGELTPLRVTPIDPALARSTHGARKWELRQLDEDEGRIKREARRGLLTRDQVREKMERLREQRKKLMTSP